MTPQAFFLECDPGQRFCIYHPAHTQHALGALIYLHPFAEEMNKSRRMAALQSRQLAAAGFSVLQIDLLGCGDSSGDFGDATWKAWQHDVVAAAAWLRLQCDAPLWLWGLRAGCLLAADAADQIDSISGFLFWQPLTSGKLFLQQFLRLRVAGEMMSGDSKGVMEALKRDLAENRAPEIAGYRLSAALARGLENALPVPANINSQLIWLELSTRTDAEFSPASNKILQQWQSAGHRVFSNVINGPAFWHTTEIEDAPALLDATLQALRAHSR